MNKLTLERIATPLLEACSKEGVTYKEAAKIFNTDPAYFKMLEREDKRGAIPEKVMDRFHSWVYSGQKLKEYKMPDAVFPLEDIADALNKVGASIVEKARSPKPVIKVKPEALARRKKEIKEKKLKLKLIPASEKPKRKYTRKPKENPPEVQIEGHFTPLWTASNVVHEWLLISPERQMIDRFSIQTIAEKVGITASVVKEIIEMELANDQKLIAGMEQSKEEVISCNPQATESETDLLKSEIKTLTFLLAEEHKANEVLRAENGYLNLMVSYKDKMIELLEKSNAMKGMFWDSLRASYSKYKSRGFWARVFNRPVK